MEKLIVLNNGEELLNLLIDKNCRKCIEQCKEKGYASLKCPLDNTTKRIGYLCNDKGFVGACDFKLTTRNFRLELQNALDCIPQLLSFRKEIETSVRKAEESKMDRIIHNLKTQNAHAIQILNLFLTREKFSYHIMSVIDDVKNIVKHNKRLTALSLLRLVKINSEMSDEIFIYENLMHGNSSFRLSIRPYDLRDVVALVIREFMPDFEKKSVTIDIQFYTEKVAFDFRVIRFILYHLTANTVKYIQPRSALNISFSEEIDSTIVTFDMRSYHITQEDLEHIYDEGYSGVIARREKTAGSGIGMYLVDKMLRFHQADLEITRGEEIFPYKGIEYSNNTFMLFIPKQSPNKAEQKQLE